MKRSTAPTRIVGGVELGRGGQGIVETMDDFSTALRFANGGTKEVENVVLVAVNLDDGRVLRPIVKTAELSKWSDAVVFKRRLPAPFIVNDDDMTQEFENTLLLASKISKGLQEGKLNLDDVKAIHEASSFLVLEVPSRDSHPENSQAVLVVGAQGKTNTEIYPFYRRLSGNLLHLEAAVGISHITGRHILNAVVATLRVLATLRKIDMHHGDIKEENIMWVSRKGSSTSSSSSSSSSSSNIQFALGDFGMVPHASARQSLHPVGTPGYQCPLLFPDTEEGRMKFTSYYPSSIPSFYYPISKAPPNKMAAAGDVWDSYIHLRHGTKIAEHDVIEKNDLYGLGVTLVRLIDSPTEVRMLASRLMTGKPKDALWHASDALDECAKIMKSEDLKLSRVYILDSAASHEDNIRLSGVTSQRKRAAALLS